MAVYWVLGSHYLGGALLNGVTLPTLPFEPRDSPHMVLPRRSARQAAAAARQTGGSAVRDRPVGPPRAGNRGQPFSSTTSVGQVVPAGHSFHNDHFAWVGGQGPPGHPHPIESTPYFRDHQQNLSSAASMAAESGSSMGVPAANSRNRHVSGASASTNNSSLSSASSRELMGEMIGRMRRGLSAAASRLFRRGGSGGRGRTPPQ